MNDSVPPTTSDYLEFHAAHRPAAVALVIGQGRVTYEQFHGDLGRFTRALRRLGLQPGTTVAVSCPHLYIEWLLLLACENLGLVTGSFLSQEGRKAESLLAYADIVLAEHAIDGVPVKRLHPITEDWIKAVLAEPGAAAEEPERIRLPLDAPQRIRRSSGTTGGQKMMIVTRRVEESMIRRYVETAGFTAASRFMAFHAFTTGGVYVRATVCLRLGATCLAKVSWHELGPLGCTHSWLQPVFLEQALDTMPDRFVRLDALTIETGGASLPKALRARALSRLVGEITNGYGGNEMGLICVMDADGVGTVLPGVELELVDDDDRPVPAGEIAHIRVRTPSTVGGYIGNPEATARMFRGGWFYPGDSGRLAARGRLQLVGRSDDVVNVGGIKMVPEAYEQDVRQVPGVADVGVVAFGGPEGAKTLGVAVVLAPGAPLDAVAAAIRKLTPVWGLAVALRAVDRLPRTDTGKIQRHLLSRLFMADRPDAGT